MPNQRNLDQTRLITENLSRSKAVYLVDYQGLPVNDLLKLREQIREAGGLLLVVKNTLFTRALRATEKDAEVKIGELKSRLEDSTAALFAFGDQVLPLKVVMKFAKEHELPRMKLGIFGHKELSAEEVERLANLPGIDQLRGQVVGMLAAPLSRLAGSLQGNLSKLMIALDEIRKQKSN
jgi:large subunit ribosomal protein L10